MDSPRVSFLMPAYNAKAYIAEAIESVRRQTYPAWELIVVDDGSDDGTGALSAEYARRDDRISVLHEPHGGSSRARNAAARRARGEYLAVMDADDIALPRRLEQSVPVLDRHPEWVALGGNAVLFSGHSNREAVSAVCCDPHRIRRLLLTVCPLMHSSALIRTDAFRRVGGYRACFQSAHDYDLWLRLSEIGALSNIPDVLYRYRVTPTGLSGSRPIEQGLNVHAARLSYLFRRAGRPDPLEGCEQITLDFLRKKGLIDRRCYREIVEKLIANAILTLRYGGSREAAAARLETARSWIRSHRVYSQYPRLWYHSLTLHHLHGTPLPSTDRALLALLKGGRRLKRGLTRLADRSPPSEL